MGRIDVHNHVLPGLDDGCRDLKDSLQLLTTLRDNGYDRVFCTSHVNTEDLQDLGPAVIGNAVPRLQAAIAQTDINIELKPGGELRLSPGMIATVERLGVPTFGGRNKYVLVDVWGIAWESWATQCVEWLQARNLQVILAHPERMGVVRKNPSFVKELMSMGLLLQGNLGPIGGGDSPEVVAIAEHNLAQGRYFMLGSDSHRPETMPVRMNGLKRAEEIVGKEKLRELTETNPAKLWE